jgi:ATP-dependent Clp protease protease subunit
MMTMLSGINKLHNYDNTTDQLNSSVMTRNDVETICYINGPITNFNDFALLLSSLKNITDKEVIRIRICSVGGSVDIGFAILNAMRACKGTIITENVGQACSMGACILMAGDKIKICEPSFTMFHNMSTFIVGDVTSIKSNSIMAVNVTKDLLFRDSVGLLSEDELKSIIENGEELFLTHSQMKSRLQLIDKLYEENE